MIYVSSSCLKKKYISESVEELARAGFSHIELSGGTQPYPSLTDDLLQLKKKYALHYLVHNYFPPPPTAFVFNLASLDDHVYDLSLQHGKTAIDLCRKIGSPAYGFHAGFYLNIPEQEIGKPVTQQPLFDPPACRTRFITAYRELLNHAVGEIELYVENNVLSAANYASFAGEDPFMCTHRQTISELQRTISCNFILDVAHLKVSCKTLGLPFADELSGLLSTCNYIHISDNDGERDSNHTLKADSALYNALSAADLRNKTLTLEIYEPVEVIRNAYNLLEPLNYA